MRRRCLGATHGHLGGRACHRRSVEFAEQKAVSGRQLCRRRLDDDFLQIWQPRDGRLVLLPAAPAIQQAVSSTETEAVGRSL